MHVIAQFEAAYISITLCLRICTLTTDYPTHTAFSPSRAEFCPLCHISKSRWLVKKIRRTLWKSKFLSNHIRQHSDLISIARYDVRTLAFAWLCVQLACRVMNYSWEVRCACWAKIDMHRSTLVEYRPETLPYVFHHYLDKVPAHSVLARKVFTLGGYLRGHSWGVGTDGHVDGTKWHYFEWKHNNS